MSDISRLELLGWPGYGNSGLGLEGGWRIWFECGGEGQLARMSWTSAVLTPPAREAMEIFMAATAGTAGGGRRQWEMPSKP